MEKATEGHEWGSWLGRLPHREKEDYAVRKKLFALLVSILLVGTLSGTAMAGQGGFIDLQSHSTRISAKR